MVSSRKVDRQQKLKHLTPEQHESYLTYHENMSLIRAWRRPNDWVVFNKRSPYDEVSMDT